MLSAESISGMSPVCVFDRRELDDDGEGDRDDEFDELLFDDDGGELLVV